jgi:hypothetical protein
MAVAVICTFPGGTTETYDDAVKASGLNAFAQHPGASFHRVAKTDSDSGIRVTDVWESREGFERFLQDKVIPVSMQVGLPEPRLEFVDVNAYMTGAPSPVPA